MSIFFDYNTNPSLMIEEAVDATNIKGYYFGRRDSFKVISYSGFIYSY